MNDYVIKLDRVATAARCLIHAQNVMSVDYNLGLSAIAASMGEMRAALKALDSESAIPFDAGAALKELMSK